METENVHKVDVNLMLEKDPYIICRKQKDVCKNVKRHTVLLDKDTGKCHYL